MALPYVDRDLELPGMQQAVDAALEAEMQATPFDEEAYGARVQQMLRVMPESTAMVQGEMERKAKGDNLPGFATGRYNLPPPPKAKQNDYNAWLEAVHNARAQLQHQCTRIENLELMTDFGGQKWMRYNEQLEQIKSDLENDLAAIKSRLDEMNWERQQEQTTAGQELYQLEVQWGQLVMQNYQLAVACGQLEEQCKLQGKPLPDSE
ncbi:uncharacterized protein MONBRDRAFT_33609 [Monosiga brevicollis MX1]|uniref:Pre-mRNA-splicing factor SPF27 n=1 Tax=Monosiga brevicollis TaxID=81824 RepID=A9V6D8_MONBE|nr:uncharacterized protein MONBRDRAFT_33609 [Monosiga brevicollis MX1]EDQ86977.1 predicted protein [Monosiga brevicollis MX1]|eukprot:XP_001748216.1 hypothetical protein [Monosiga brevicollis MX1]